MITEPKAFELTLEVKDKGHNPICCALCGRKSRYAYMAKSRKEGLTWSVQLGPECAGQVYNPAAIADSLSNNEWLLRNKSALQKKARHNRLLSIVIYLRKHDPEFDYTQVIQACSAHTPEITPRQASLIISRCKKTSLSIDSDILPIRLNTSAARLQIQDMNDWMWQEIAPHLTKKQIMVAEKLRSNK